MQLSWNNSKVRLFGKFASQSNCSEWIEIGLKSHFFNSVFLDTAKSFRNRNHDKKILNMKPFSIPSNPSRDFSPNLKQDLSGLSGFFRHLRSKFCLKMSGLSGSCTVYLKKPLKNRARFEWFWAVYLKKTLKSCAVFERFFFRKTAQKPLKPLILKQDFQRNCLKKLLKPLKSCFKLGAKSRLGAANQISCLYFLRGRQVLIIFLILT